MFDTYTINWIMVVTNSSFINKSHFPDFLTNFPNFFLEFLTNIFLFYQYS